MSVVTRPEVFEFAEMEMNLHGKYNESEQYTVNNSNLQEMKLLHQIYVPSPQNNLYDKAIQVIQTRNSLHSQTQQYLPTQESNYMYQKVAQQLYAQYLNQIPQSSQDLYQVQQASLQDSQYQYNQVTQHLLQSPHHTQLYTPALQSPIKFNQQLTNTPQQPQSSQQTSLPQQSIYRQTPLQDSQYPYNQVTQHLVVSPHQPQLCTTSPQSSSMQCNQQLTNTLQQSQSPQQTSLHRQPFYEQAPLQDPYNQVAELLVQSSHQPQSPSIQWNQQLTNTTQQPHSPQRISPQQSFSPLQDFQYPYNEVAQHLVQSPHQPQLYTTLPEHPSIQENQQFTNIPQQLASLHQQPVYGYQQNIQHRISESSEDYASSSSPGGAPKRVRTCFTPFQTETLKKYYYSEEFSALDAKQQTAVKKELAKELGLPFQVVKNWFQNRKTSAQKQERRDKENQLDNGSPLQKRCSVTSARQNAPKLLKNTYKQRQNSCTLQESSLSPPDNFRPLTNAINIGYSEESSPEGSSLASPDNHRENINNKESYSHQDSNDLTDTTIVDYVLSLDLKDERNSFQQEAHLNNCFSPRTVIVHAEEKFSPSRTDLGFHNGFQSTTGQFIEEEKCSKLTNLALVEENAFQPITNLALGDDFPVPNESLADCKIKYELQEFLKF